MSMSKPQFITNSYSKTIPGDPNHKYNFMETEDPKTGINILFEKFPYSPYMARYKNISCFVSKRLMTGEFVANIRECFTNGSSKHLETIKGTSQNEIFKQAHLKMVKLASDKMRSEPK